MTDNAARVSASRLGLWVAPATAAVSVVSLAVSVSTPVHAGPWCNDGCVVYPYTDAAAFVPRDYLWIYPEVLLVLLFVLLAVCLLHWVPSQQKLSAAIYRGDLYYWFELMSLSITWLVLVVSGTVLTVVFGRALKVATQRPAGVTTDALAGR